MTSTSDPDDPAAVDGYATALRRSALAYCQRYAASEAHLALVLRRKLSKWLRADTPERGGGGDAADRLVAEVVATCRRLGLVDDRAFAEAKVSSGRRRGLSSARLARGLLAQGVDRETVAEALAGDDVDDRRAALLFARRKRLGPWRTSVREDSNRRDLAALCRNGHALPIARWVIALDRDSAEDALVGDG